MYYYGYNGATNYATTGYMMQPYAGYTTGGYSCSAALWIVLFILLVIIIGVGWTGRNFD